MLDKIFSRRHIEMFFLNFFEKSGFDISCKLSPLGIICMKCQNLFSGKIRKISCLSSAELAQRVVMVKQQFEISVFEITGVNCTSIFTAVGVDNAFVIMTTWNRVNSANKDISVEERIALTMQHAGVSISVTSISDLVAFACGISTVKKLLLSILEKIQQTTF